MHQNRLNLEVILFKICFNLFNFPQTHIISSLFFHFKQIQSIVIGFIKVSNICFKKIRAHFTQRKGLS